MPYPSCGTAPAPRSSPRSANPTSHVATILTADLIQRPRDLPERADLDALHELSEHVAAARRHLLQLRQRRGGTLRVARLEGTHRGHLILLLLFGRADQFGALVLIADIACGEEGIDANERQRAIVLARLVVQRFLLDLTALVHGLHRPEDATTFGQRLELPVYRLLHEVGEILDGERALPGILDLV